MQALSVHRPGGGRCRGSAAGCALLGIRIDMALANWAAMRRSSAASPASLHTATSPRLRALAQLKLGLAVAAGARVLERADRTGAVARPSAPSICRIDWFRVFLSRGRVRASVASGVMMSSALASVTTFPLPSAQAGSCRGRRRSGSGGRRRRPHPAEGRELGRRRKSRVRLGILVAKRRRFHANSRVAGDVAEHGLVAAAKRRGTAEQLTLDLIVSRPACAALLRIFARCRDFVAVRRSSSPLRPAKTIMATISRIRAPRAIAARTVGFTRCTVPPTRSSLRGSTIRDDLRAGEPLGPSSRRAARCASRPARSCPRRGPASRNSARTVSAVASSRLPVGSSASTSAGLLASARATATRCCSPPDSLDGRWSGAGRGRASPSSCFGPLARGVRFARRGSAAAG